MNSTKRKEKPELNYTVIKDGSEVKCPNIKPNGERCNKLFFERDGDSIRIKCRGCGEYITYVLYPTQRNK